MATGLFTATIADNWVFQAYTDLAIVVNRSNAIMPGLLDRKYEAMLGAGKGDRVNIPVFSQSAASTVTKRSTFGTAATLTTQNVTEGNVVLQVNILGTHAFAIPKEDDEQMSPAYRALLVEGASMSLTQQIDTDLLGDNTNGIDAATTTVGTDNVPITEDDIMTVSRNLSNANAGVGTGAPAGGVASSAGRHLVCSPTSIMDLRKIESARNSLYASATGNLPSDNNNGYIGQYHGFFVHETTLVEAGAAGAKNGAFHSSAIAFAMPGGIRVSRGEQLIGNATVGGLTNEYVAWTMYGFVIERTAFLNELDGR